MNRRVFLGCCGTSLIAALRVQSVEAHSTFIATYSFQKTGPATWVLTVSLPLAELHQSLLQAHHQEELVIDGGYNEALAVDYLLEHCLVTANEKFSIKLDSTFVRIDNHQSEFGFRLKGVPDSLHSLHFEIDAMSENAGHVNLVRIRKPRFNKKVILQSANEYAGSIDLIGGS